MPSAGFEPVITISRNQPIWLGPLDHPLSSELGVVFGPGKRLCYILSRRIIFLTLHLRDGVVLNPIVHLRRKSTFLLNIAIASSSLTSLQRVSTKTAGAFCFQIPNAWQTLQLMKEISISHAYLMTTNKRRDCWKKIRFILQSQDIRET